MNYGGILELTLIIITALSYYGGTVAQPDFCFRCTVTAFLNSFGRDTALRICACAHCKNVHHLFDIIRMVQKIFRNGKHLKASLQSIQNWRWSCARPQKLNLKLRETVVLLYYIVCSIVLSYNKNAVWEPNEHCIYQTPKGGWHTVE